MSRDHDPQDPLPEIKFFWRRWFTYVVTLVLLGLLGLIVWALREAVAAQQLADVAFWLICLIAWMVTTYMLAPSGEQIATAIQASRMNIAKTNAEADHPAPDPEPDFTERKDP